MRWRFVLVLFVLLGFCTSVVVPAEDVPETAYDELETLPYEGIPLFSLAVPQAVTAAPKVLACVSSPRLSTVGRRSEGYWKHRAWATPILDRTAGTDPRTASADRTAHPASEDNSSHSQG